MAIFEKRLTRGRGKGQVASKFSATKKGNATLGVSSDAEMAAKAPAGANIPKNHLENALFTADSRYPGAGSTAVSWAGFSCTDDDFNRGAGAFYPIRITSNEQAGQSNGGLNIGLSGSVPAGDSLTIRVTFSGDSVPDNTRDFTFTEQTATTKFKSTAGLTIGDYNLVAFSFIEHNGVANNGGTFYFNNFFIVHSIDTSQTGGQNQYGGAYNQSGTWTIPQNDLGHPNPQISVNGTGSFWYKNVMPSSWLHYNSIYFSDDTGVWDTAFRKKWLRHRKFGNDYRDIREHNDSSPGSNNVGYTLGPLQRRIIELSGTDGGRLTDTKTQNWSPPAGETTIDRGYYRSYPDIAMWGLTTDSLRSSPTGAIAGKNNINEIDGWVKHSCQQSVRIPENANYIKYGAYVRCPANSPFRRKNFAAIEVSQDRGAGIQNSPEYPNNDREVWGDSIRFVEKQYAPSADNVVLQGPGFSITGGSPSVHPPLIQHTDSPKRTQYNWNGLASIYDDSPSASEIASNINNIGPHWPRGYRYPTKLNVDGIIYHDTPYRDFKLVEREWRGYHVSPSAPYQGLRLPSDMSPSHTYYAKHVKQVKYLKYELCFYEWSRNFSGVAPETHPDYKSGKVQFFCPYVLFFGANDTPLDVSP